MPTDVAAALADLATVFARLRVRWYVFGAQAVIAAGVPRLTADIDVTIEPPRGGNKKLVDALASSGIEVGKVGDLDSFIAETRVIPTVHTPTNVPIDIVLAGPGLEEEMLGRVQIRRVGRVEIPYVDTADLIALKILSGRDKDLEDVSALLRIARPGSTFDVARRRVAELAALIDDSTLVSTFDRLVAAPTPTMKTPKTKTKTARARTAKPKKR